jgi:NTP pyrophosphatase (non-canonical NTP hydrolase)
MTTTDASEDAARSGAPSSGRPASAPASAQEAAAAPDALTELRDALRRFAAERDWDPFHTPKSLVCVEAAELLEPFQWMSDAQSSALAAPTLSHVRQEMADVLLYLIRIADKLEVDLAAAAREKMVVNAQRYPPSKARGTSRKYTEL